MTVFIQQGNRYMAVSEEALKTTKKLPAKTFSIGLSDKGYFLEVVEDFKISHKIYGDTAERAKRIINTFRDRTKNTGVLLSGLKGSGKTLLAKKVSILCLEDGVPTLIVNSALAGEPFNKFIQNIEQECVIIFDEFEKVYEEEQQDAILTLFDGTYETKKLFIVTCNDISRISQHMKNRPGRMYYAFDYAGLSQSFVEGYVEDNLVNKNYTKDMLVVCSMLGKLSFDILQALVEEVNRYDEKPLEALRVLNAYLSTDRERYMIHCTDKKVVFNENPNGLFFSPITGSTSLQYSCGELDEDGDEIYEQFLLSPSRIMKADVKTGVFVYSDGKFEVVLTRDNSVSPAASFEVMEYI